jgi:hypothetical protein
MPASGPCRFFIQVFALRKALGADRDVIRTEFGRGYRFAAALRVNVPADVCRYSARAKAAGWPNFGSTELSAKAPV